MNIDIKTYGPDFDSELRCFTRYCAAFELGTQISRIDAIKIHLLHTHDARNRKNKHCVVEVELSDGFRVVTRDADLDHHVAIFRALEAAGSICARQQSRGDIDVASLPVPPQSESGSGEPDRVA